MTENRKFNKINIVISIIIAFISWIYVVYNYSPMKTVTYVDIPITYVGMDVLAERGLGIKSTTADTVDIKLDVERTEYTNITSEDISVIADVSEAVAGNNGISLEVTPPEGTVIRSTENRIVTVEVDESSTKDVDVVAIYDHSAVEGQEPVTSIMSYRRVSIVGYKKNVDKVKYAVVKINSYNLNDEPKTFVLNPIAVDENGKAVPHVQVLPSEIAVSAIAGITKDVELIVSVNGAEKGMNYTVPKTVKIKGTAEALKNVKKIEAEPVDITGIIENTVISINYNLPEGVFLAQDAMTQGVSITKEK